MNRPAGQATETRGIGGGKGETEEIIPIHDVVIVGGGPTGLLTALLLAAKNRSPLVLEQHADVPPESRAIGITPPSLEVFSSIGLSEELLARGVLVQHAVVHDARRTLGSVSFHGVHPRFPGVLSCPQAATWSILRAAVAADPRVELRCNARVDSARRTTSGFVLNVEGGAPVAARVLVVADGARGTTAESLGFRRHSGRYRQRFFMADMADDGGSAADRILAQWDNDAGVVNGHHASGGPDTATLGQEAHLWFTADGAVESFPLPDGLRRWIVQLDDAERVGTEVSRRSDLEEDVDLEGMVARRTGIRLNRDARRWQSRFQPSWSRLFRFAGNRVLVVGDAAHTMSPIGGQGMNTGFADAEHAAALIADCLGRENDAVGGGEAVWNRAARRYHRRRIVAARTATRRAWAGMTVGSFRGGFKDMVRSVLIACTMRSPIRPLLARHFAMITIPRTVSPSG